MQNIELPSRNVFASPSLAGRRTANRVVTLQFANMDAVKD
jgi:hypothetical protein